MIDNADFSALDDPFTEPAYLVLKTLFSTEVPYKLSVEWADKRWGLGEEVSYQYCHARQRGEDPVSAILEAYAEWDILDLSPNIAGSLEIPQELIELLENT